MNPLITQCRDLAARLRTNRHEVHGFCCNDTDDAVPCESRVCAIEYEAEQLLQRAADTLERTSL